MAAIFILGVYIDPENSEITIPAFIPKKKNSSENCNFRPSLEPIYKLIQST
jgi:hypothetical protein